jgi:RNA polymerase sigma-70 factor (ECF subfamily)
LPEVPSKGHLRGAGRIGAVAIDAAAATRVAEVYRRHHDGILAFLVHRIHDRERAEELANDVFVELIVRLDSVEGDALPSWLYMVAERRAIDDLRRRTLRPTSSLGDAAENVPARVSAEPAFAETVSCAIRPLPPTQRHVLLLHLVRGLSFAEIATELDTSEPACRMRFRRAVEAVRGALRAQGFDVAVPVATGKALRFAPLHDGSVRGLVVAAVSFAVASYAVAVALLLGLAATHKLIAVAEGRAAEEPLLQTSRFRAEHAAVLLLAAAAAELGIAGLLLGSPRVGFVLAAALIAVYWHELRQLSPTGSCNCFGRALAGRSVRVARIRNVALSGLCLVGAAATAGVDVVPTNHLANVAATALLLLSIPAAVAVVPIRR